MIRRKMNNEKCGCCCTLKEKLQYLWEHTMGAIKKVNDITPDGDGKFTVEAGQNVNLTPISNGMRISTTGEVSYYSAGDTYVDVDNNDLKISLKNPGQTGGVALHNDLEVVAQSVNYLMNNTQRPIAYYDFADNITPTSGQESQGNLQNIRKGFNILTSNILFESGSGVTGFVFGVSINGNTTWLQSMYNIPANDTVRISVPIIYNENTDHRVAIKIYTSSSITTVNVNTRIISL